MRKWKIRSLAASFGLAVMTVQTVASGAESVIGLTIQAQVDRDAHVRLIANIENLSGQPQYREITSESPPFHISLIDAAGRDLYWASKQFDGKRGKGLARPEGNVTVPLQLGVGQRVQYELARVGIPQDLGVDAPLPSGTYQVQLRLATVERGNGATRSDLIVSNIASITVP